MAFEIEKKDVISNTWVASISYQVFSSRQWLFVNTKSEVTFTQKS